VPRGIRNKMGCSSSRSSRTDSKEIRIQIIKPDQSTELPQALETVESKSFYFCTTCDTSFDDSKSWREHEYETHERQYFWSCPAPGCSKRIVTCSADFEKHHEEAHGCENCSHAYGVKRPFPSKRAWGCGFDNCQETFNSWDLRCDHVATHFEEMADDDDKESHLNQWKYSNMIRNLLRQPDVNDAYDREMTKLHGDDKVFWPRMKWQADSSTDLRRRLEYRDFREGVKEIASMSIRLGSPQAQSPLPPQSPPPPPPTQPQIPQINLTESEDVTPRIVNQMIDSPINNYGGALVSPLPLDPKYLSHIDKFPPPGTNPFDFYGPVPPSPIIQLDFCSNLNDPDPKISPIAHEEPHQSTAVHSNKSSISSHQPYSLYPTLPTPDEKEPSLKQTPYTPPPLDLMHELNTPTESLSFQTATTWATAFSNAKETTPPRPKTPLSMFRSAKGLMRKKSHGQMRANTPIESFDSVAAQKEISFFSR
jgi:hypothetical protein